MEATMELLGQLTPLHGGDSIPLAAPVLTVGRAAGCDVVIRHRSVSSRHCRLTYRAGSWIVEDLESHNGTFVGRVPCKRGRVKSGATIRIGAIRFELTATPVQSTAPATSDDEDLAIELIGGTTEPETSDQPAMQARRTPPPVARQRPTSNLPVERQRVPSGNLSKETHGRPDANRTVAKAKLTKPEPAGLVKRSGKRFLGKLTPKAGGDPIALMDDQIVIGRGRDCGIRLKYSTVSTKHCRLTFQEGHWSVCDLDSRNGIRVNKQPTNEEWLMPGDVLAIGKLQFEIDYQPRSDTPPPAFDVTAGKSLLEKAGLEEVLESDANPSWLVTDQDPEMEQRIDLESL